MKNVTLRIVASVAWMNKESNVTTSAGVTSICKKKDDTISMDIVSIEKWIGISRIKRIYRNHIIKQHNRVIFYD